MEEEEQERSNYAPVILIVFFVSVVIVVCSLLNYKSEVLTCNKAEDICQVERVNLFNMPSTKKIAKYSDITGVSYFRQRIKGNRYGKGYKEYILTFDTKNNDKISIFSKTYYEKEELEAAIKELSAILKENTDEFSYNRD